MRSASAIIASAVAVSTASSAVACVPMSTTDASVIVPISAACRPAAAAAAASERMKLAMKVGALSSNSANASTVVMFALLSITSMVDASSDMPRRLQTRNPFFSYHNGPLLKQSVPPSPQGSRGRPGACCHAIPHPRKPPWTPMKPFYAYDMRLCFYVIPWFVRPLPERCRHADLGIKSPPITSSASARNHGICS